MLLGRRTCKEARKHKTNPALKNDRESLWCICMPICIEKALKQGVQTTQIHTLHTYTQHCNVKCSTKNFLGLTWLRLPSLVSVLTWVVGQILRELSLQARHATESLTLKPKFVRKDTPELQESCKWVTPGESRVSRLSLRERNAFPLPRCAACFAKPNSEAASLQDSTSTWLELCSTNGKADDEWMCVCAHISMFLGCLEVLQNTSKSLTASL